ncbi:hypothetical protein KP509_13G013100 [Ceratopteris richardii]|uniref:F-box protein At3g26010-like beta-propeller domain-containing protein n=1 Tax=Ceratopteris richardii TaxID=49495 RepID=A0A8T2TDB4_CERRI|nr:hypothetical protein KP509_13G013100 [Ceratopteris richardii]
MGNGASCREASLWRSIWCGSYAIVGIRCKSIDLLPQGLACLLPDQGSSASENHLVFADLPQDLLDRIRACLPLSAYIRSSLVSKYWKNSTFSPSTLALCSTLHSSEPWLFALSIEPANQGSYAFDSEFCRWRRVQFPFMSRDLMYPVAAANGLLCVNAYGEDQALLVVNPLMGTYRELPRWKEERFDPVVGLIVNPQTCTFKVIAVGSYEAEAVTEVYDSRTNQWSITCRLPMHRKLASSCSLFSKGLFYCWSAGSREALLVYNIQDNVWSEIPMVLPSSYAYGKLVEYRDNVLLVGMSHGPDAFKSIRIWELQEPGKEMIEVARMPYGILKEFCGKGKGPLNYQIVSSGDLLYLYAKRSTRLVVCNLTKNPPRWQQLTPSSTFAMDRSEIYLFSFCVHVKIVSSITMES